MIFGHLVIWSFGTVLDNCLHKDGVLQLPISLLELVQVCSSLFFNQVNQRKAELQRGIEPEGTSKEERCLETQLVVTDC